MNQKKDTMPLNKCCMNMINEGLYLPNRQLSALLAILLFIFFSFFMVGYFYGKRFVIEQHISRINVQPRDAQENNSIESSLDFYTDVVVTDEGSVYQEDAATMITKEHLYSDDTLLQQPMTEEKFYAKLIGFGTEKAATVFVEKLKNNDIMTYVKKHANKTAKGRTMHWYQVVTDTYTNKQELLNIVERITIQEKLKDVVISTC
jgi:hypothetical protein